LFEQFLQIIDKVLDFLKDVIYGREH
jgi:hypothetical protein